MMINAKTVAVSLVGIAETAKTAVFVNTVLIVAVNFARIAVSV